MTNLLSTVHENLLLIKLCFSGTYKQNDLSIFLDEQVTDLDIPTYIDDRNNLRIDRNNVSKSYRNAVDAKKLELTQ